jgi:uncharacterized membrane protein YkvA (DUF1232 family)
MTTSICIDAYPDRIAIVGWTDAQFFFSALISAASAESASGVKTSA